MERKNFNYSLKNIPIPSRNNYKKQLIEKVESVLKRMRWKVFFFEKHDEREPTDKFGFKSKKCPPQNRDLDKIEDDVLSMIKNVKFRSVNNDNFMNTLKEDTKKINQNPRTLVFADKSRNIYELGKEAYNEILTNNITKTYKKANVNIERNINKEAKTISENFNVDDRMEIMAKRQAFFTLKDHKENVQINPKCRLINPTKSEVGIISKRILEGINNNLRNVLNVNQWRNTAAVIHWFKNIPNKAECTFTVFDIVDFYPSISEKLLNDAIEFGRVYMEITEREKPARKSLLFDKDIPWEKKESQNMFDVTMGSYDGAEVCELVGLLILHKLGNLYQANDIGLYRDDGLSVFNNVNGSQAERIKKNIRPHKIN